MNIQSTNASNVFIDHESIDDDVEIVYPIRPEPTVIDLCMEEDSDDDDIHYKMGRIGQYCMTTIKKYNNKKKTSDYIQHYHQ